jgi:pyochelin biosynthetic protein PchC
MTSVISTAWLQTWRGGEPSDGPLLICFPHLGGGSSAFREWPAYAGRRLTVAAVRYPARESRLAEPLPATWRGLVAGIVDGIAPALHGPYALFGHSMGAHLAYESAIEIGRRGLPAPVRVFVSGAEAPERAAASVRIPSGADPMDWVQDLGGMPDEVALLPELRELVAPAVRGDHRLMSDYAPSGERLSCDLTVVRGAQDPVVTAAGQADWAKRTTGHTDFRTARGDHFAHLADPGPILDIVLSGVAGRGQ